MNSTNKTKKLYATVSNSKTEWAKLTCNCTLGTLSVCTKDYISAHSGNLVRVQWVFKETAGNIWQIRATVTIMYFLLYKFKVTSDWVDDLSVQLTLMLSPTKDIQKSLQ